MKKIRIYVTVLFMALIGFTDTSCVTVERYRTVTMNDVIQMPPFDATAEDIDISHPLFLYHCVDIWLRRSDNGHLLDLQICPANEFIVRFARSLHQGQQYSFPKVFGDYVTTATNSVNTVKDQK